MTWWLFGRDRRRVDDNICGSGLNRRDWLLVARVVEDIGCRGTLSPEERDLLKPLFDGTLKHLRDAPAVGHLEAFVLDGDNASLDSAAQALAPGFENPWLVISKSL